MSEDDFQERYERALNGLASDQIEQVAQLEPFRLREWVDSPAKIRPFLLGKWQKQDKEHQQAIEKIKTKNKKRWFDFFWSPPCCSSLETLSRTLLP
jgi:hypothetical protein